MADRPNVLFLMTDQMQGRVLEPDHPCITPNLDRLAERGVRIRRAYTPNPVCSPARASLMTGLLPHNHGVYWVTHTAPEGSGRLRPEKAHWAQKLRKAGYRTGYFGKWHVEHDEAPAAYGWDVDGSMHGERWRHHRERVLADEPAPSLGEPTWHQAAPEGYESRALYGVTDRPPEKRPMGLATDLALAFLDDALAGSAPWCCFVSAPEPHDPFLPGREAMDRYDVEDIRLAPNVGAEHHDRPGAYRKAARAQRGMTERQYREAAACYYAYITEIDAQFGRLLERLERAGELERTVVVLTSDHGELLGAHNLYCKNVSAHEEAYHIPMVAAGPGIAEGRTTDARVGLHELGPTLLELADADPLPEADGSSFAPLLRDPDAHDGDRRTGLAEYHGSRYLFTQRVYWEDDWKLVFNGFDIDELYELASDPYELTNLAERPDQAPRLRGLTARLWQRLRDNGDTLLVRAGYPGIRLAPYGPNVEA